MKFKFFIAVVAVLFQPLTAGAWDPTIVVAGFQAASSMMDGLNKADEMVDMGFALSELLSELGVETGSEEEMTRAVTRLEELNRKAKDLKWSTQEIKQALESDLNSASSLKDRLKGLRNMIAASKKIAEVMAVRPKAGAAATQIQSIRINSMILEELQGQRRQQFLAYLDQRERQSRREIFMQEILEKESSKSSWSQK